MIQSCFYGEAVEKLENTFSWGTLELSDSGTEQALCRLWTKQER